MTKERRNNCIRKNAGTTLVEMIVVFALLSIFMTAAAAIIASVTNLYYAAKGETYGRQVSDIIMEKIAAELEGAKYEPGISPSYPESGGDYSYIKLYDRTDTLVTLVEENGELLVKYDAVKINGVKKNATVWKYDENVYNQYNIAELSFVPVSEIGNYGLDNCNKYGFNPSGKTYASNIVFVFLEIDSPKYGTYRTVRPMKLFYVPDSGEINL